MSDTKQMTRADLMAPTDADRAKALAALDRAWKAYDSLKDAYSKREGVQAASREYSDAVGELLLTSHTIRAALLNTPAAEVTHD